MEMEAAAETTEDRGIEGACSVGLDAETMGAGACAMALTGADEAVRG